MTSRVIFRHILHFELTGQLCHGISSERLSRNQDCRGGRMEKQHSGFNRSCEFGRIAHKYQMVSWGYCHHFHCLELICLWLFSPHNIQWHSVCLKWSIICYCIFGNFCCLDTGASCKLLKYHFLEFSHRKYIQYTLSVFLSLLPTPAFWMLRKFRHAHFQRD